MKLRHSLKKQLSIEFPRIRPDILKVIVGIVTAGMNKKTHDQIFIDIFEEDTRDFPEVEQRENMIYQTLLICAREICSDPIKIKEIKEVIQKTAEKLRAKNTQNPKTNTSSVLQVGPSCSIFASDTAPIYEKTSPDLLMENEIVGEKRKKC